MQAVVWISSAKNTACNSATVTDYVAEWRAKELCIKIHSSLARRYEILRQMSNSMGVGPKCLTVCNPWKNGMKN